MTYTRNQIKKAGKILKEKELYSSDEVNNSEDILTYWRTVHGKVLNEIYGIVYTTVSKINKEAFVAQRIKRSPSIIRKLKRAGNNHLTTMQDIAGVRAVVDNLKELKRLEVQLKKNLVLHEFKSEDDYINSPKESGYRSIHLVYKYRNLSDPESDGLLVEIQIRTKLQHAWATSVETMGTFLGSQLKFNEGQPKWLKYFALTSSAFSFLEKSNPVPKFEKLSEIETYQQALYEFNYNKIEDNLKAYSTAADVICKDNDALKRYHIVILSVKDKTVQIISYNNDQFRQANIEYTNLERRESGNEFVQVVLVSTESIFELRDAFPNYFLDTREFLSKMDLIKKKVEALKSLEKF
jgi:putative GTP pyrophosphokinase